jgi:hypothetical protein
MDNVFYPITGHCSDQNRDGKARLELSKPGNLPAVLIILTDSRGLESEVL